MQEDGKYSTRGLVSDAEDTRNPKNSYLLWRFSAQLKVPAARELNTGPSALKISPAWAGGEVISPSEDGHGERAMQTVIIFSLAVHTWTDHGLVNPRCIPHCLLLLEQLGELNATFTVSPEAWSRREVEAENCCGVGSRGREWGVGSGVGSGILEKSLLS